MCGIYGYVNFEEHDLLRRMGDVIQHRGPDDVGYYTNNKVHLGIRRLSIIDLEGGRQPVYNEDRSIVVVFNGEIYNYLELSAELRRQGHRFRSRSDTEVLVHAYEEYGIDFLEKLNGMFAFALYDTRKQEFFLVRDRMGIKPVYYYYQYGKFLFASEVKAILESDSVERRCDTDCIDSYLKLRYVPQPKTMFHGINTLPAGYYLRIKEKQFQTIRYWQIPLHNGGYHKNAYYNDLFEDRFLHAIKLRMRSDVPVGAYLSGGVDSSLVVAGMKRFVDRIKTFSIGFESPIDETSDARKLASLLQCDHHEVECLPQHFDLLPKVIWHLERPIGDALILAYYLLAEEAAKHVKVVLAGEGADEIFGGYLFHKVIKWTQIYSNIVPDSVTQRVLVPLVDYMPVGLLNKYFIHPAYLGHKGKQKLVAYLKHYSKRSLTDNYNCLKTLFDLEERNSLYTEAFKKSVVEDVISSNLDQDTTNGKVPFLDQLLALQFDDWLQDNLLLRQDKNTMAHSLELRVPFLDHKLVELAFQVPPTLKVHGFTDKYIERELARRMLPRENARRSKNPFYIPVEYFHKHPQIRNLIRLTLNQGQVERRGYFHYPAVKSLIDKMESGEFIYAKQVIALVILELWHLVFIDKQKMW